VGGCLCVCVCVCVNVYVCMCMCVWTVYVVNADKKPNFYTLWVANS
jgi:hypothetical protein